MPLIMFLIIKTFGMLVATTKLITTPIGQIQELRFSSYYKFNK